MKLSRKRRHILSNPNPDVADSRFQFWVRSAKALDERQVIEVGSTVQVIEISGATALVFDHKQ